MNTETLQYFIKVYEKKSISSAAKDLFITPQGLSKTIKQLELELEAELFYRDSHGMEATEYGELLYARAKHICYLLEDIKKEFSIIDGKKNILSVLVTYAASYAVPPDILYQFSEVHQNIQMELKELPDEYSVEKLLQKEVDVGLIMGHEDNVNYAYEVILPGEIVILVSKDHPLAKKDEISIIELEHESLVIKAVEAEKDHSFVDKCLEYGFPPNIKQEIGNMLTAHVLCEKSGLVGVSVDFIEEVIKNDKLKVLKLKEKIPQNIYFITKKRDLQSTAVTVFRDYLKDYMKERKNISK